jgi:tetratricopeptide (TPR) repeat protein
MKFYNYLLIVLFSCSVLAQGDDTFEKANSAYADDEFEQAVKLYDSVLADGFVSAELYFNLGNAYFKQNDLANAIYHYEKALQYNPSDQDIQENLEIANTQTIDKIEDVPESNLNSLIYNITHAMTLNSWGWLSIILSVLFGVFMVLYFRSSATKGKRRNFSIAILLVVLAAASLLFGRFQNELQEEQSYAIIFENQLPAHVEPNPRSDVNFELNQGTKVSLGSTFREYTQIELPDGSKGWIKTLSFKKL